MANSDSTTLLTRRATLAGLPVIIAGATIAAYAANTATGPDAELLAMIERWSLVNGEYASLYSAIDGNNEAPAAMRETIEVLGAEAADLFSRIMATRAKTPQGMLAKLDTYSDEPFIEPEAASVYDDLRVLCGLEPSASVVEGES